MRRTHLLVLSLFALLAVALTYPLITHLATHVPGSDTWAYDEYTFLWNIWTFKHALIDGLRSPLTTDLIFFPVGMGLVMYTFNLVAAALALPIHLATNNIPLSYNLVNLLSSVLGGYGSFLLVRYLLRRQPGHPRQPSFVVFASAVLAGLVYAFAASRSIYLALGHTMIVTTQWVPFFALYFVRLLDRWRTHDALLAGLFLALALLTDMLYGVLLGLIAAVLLVDWCTYFALGLLGIALIFSVAAASILEWSIFRRIGRLARQVHWAKHNGGRPVSVTLEGNDELTLVAHAINRALLRMDTIRSQQERQAESLAQTLEELRQQHADLENSHRHLQQLQRASASLTGTLEIKDALKQLEDVALDIFQADELWLLRLEDGRLEGMRSFSRTATDARLPRLFGCDGPTRRLQVGVNRLLDNVLAGNALFIDSIGKMSADEQSRLFGGPIPNLGGLCSLAVVPLLVEQQPVGLAVSASVKESQFGEDRRSTIALFASQVAQALKNARLYEEIKALGEIDSLTGLYNRRKALEQLESEISRAKRYQGIFSVLMCDIDNFKLFNDTYGHPAGDDIIGRVAGVLRHGTRNSDFVGRYGGDEFLLILPETYRATAGRTADHLRAALGSLPYVGPNGAAIPLRMSFGAAAFPEDGTDAVSLIAAADANLYESKRWGGDTVTVDREEFRDGASGSKGFSTLDALVSAVDNKDHYTRRHSAQVAEHALAIARALRLRDDTQAKLQVAALLHDVGKIALPDRILRKPGALTPEETEAVKHHSPMGGMMISQHLPELDEVARAVTSHHERWDGKGYPAGLRGMEIPLAARILSVADVYSAMTTDRPYRAALTMEQAIEELKNGGGAQFDPDVVRILVDCLAKGCAATPTRGRVADDVMARIAVFAHSRNTL